MGKYDKQIRESDGDSPEIYYGRALLICANELAEANRLKRIEIKTLAQGITNINDIYYQGLKKDLEDQA